MRFRWQRSIVQKAIIMTYRLPYTTDTILRMRLPSVPHSLVRVQSAVWLLRKSSLFIGLWELGISLTSTSLIRSAKRIAKNVIKLSLSLTPVPLPYQCVCGCESVCLAFLFFPSLAGGGCHTAASVFCVQPKFIYLRRIPFLLAYTYQLIARNFLAERKNLSL